MICPRCGRKLYLVQDAQGRRFYVALDGSRYC